MLSKEALLVTSYSSSSAGGEGSEDLQSHSACPPPPPRAPRPSRSCPPHTLDALLGQKPGGQGPDSLEPVRAPCSPWASR